jgi:hypothetical protein
MRHPPRLEQLPKYEWMSLVVVAMSFCGRRLR